MTSPITVAARRGRRAATHPLATAAVLLTTAAGTWGLWAVGAPYAPTLAWVVLALAAGYAVSGSV
jgi:hypothetical protein